MWLGAVLAVIDPRIAELARMGPWPAVEYRGDLWLVAPRQIPGVTIGEARRITSAAGFELPTPGLVARIHEVAGCKLAGGTLYTWPMKGTPEASKPRAWLDARMNSPEVHALTAARVAADVEAWRALHGRDPILVSGAYKNVGIDERGIIGIVGWPMTNGKNRQGWVTIHGPHHGDYSQGATCVLRWCVPLDLGPILGASFQV